MRALHSSLVAVSALASVVLAAGAANAAIGEPEHPGVTIGGVTPGATIEAHVGSGFDPNYNVGVGGRLGYTTSGGIFLGADATHFFSSPGGNDRTLLGGDVGLKIFPTYHLEVRPYGLVGADIPAGGNAALALAPGVVGAYHFGAAYVDVDARWMATPAPNVFMLMGGLGIGF